MIPATAALTLASLLFAGAARPERTWVEQGAALAQDRCGACHAVAGEAASPDAAAPPFRDLNRAYPVADLIGAIAEGAATGHPRMPRFHLSSRQRRALVAYVRSVQR